MGRRHRRGFGAAPRHADGLRRSRRGLHDHARGVQAQHAGPHHRRLGRPAGQQGAAHGLADARTAHQARARHLEHLHRLGPDGLDDGLLLRLQRSRRAAPRGGNRPPGRRNRRPRAGGDGLPPRVEGVLRHARSRGRGSRRAIAGARTGHQLLLSLRRARAHVVRRGDHRGGDRDRREHLRRSQRQESQGGKGRHRKLRPNCPAPPIALFAGTRIQRLPLGERPDALHQEAGVEGYFAGQFNDLFRFVHHEAQRRGAHAAALAGRLPEHAPLRPGRPGQGLYGPDRRAGTGPGDDHRLRGLLVAAQFGRGGRIHGADGHPRLPPEPRTGLPQRGADPRVGPRHEPRLGGHGRHEDRDGDVRRARQHRRGGPRSQGQRALVGTVRPDGHLPLDARRLREPHPRDRRRCPRRRRAGLHGRREHERAGGTDEPRLYRGRRLPPQPPQDLRHAPRRRRPGRRPDLRRRAPAGVPAVAPGRRHGRRRGHHGRRVGPVGFGAALPDHLRLYQNAGGRGTSQSHRDGHRQRQLHVGGAGRGVPHLLLGRDGPRGPRDDPRPHLLQEGLQH